LAVKEKPICEKLVKGAGERGRKKKKIEKKNNTIRAYKNKGVGGEKNLKGHPGKK